MKKASFIAAVCLMACCRPVLLPAAPAPRDAKPVVTEWTLRMWGGLISPQRSNIDPKGIVMDMAVDLIKATDPVPTPKVAESMASMAQSAQSQADAFAGLTGQLWNNVARFGIIGVVAFVMTYLVMHEIPATQERFHNELRIERESNQKQIDADRKATREDRAAAMKHADTITEKITTAMGKNLDAVNAQTKELSAQIRATGMGPPKP